MEHYKKRYVINRGLRLQEVNKESNNFNLFPQSLSELDL